METISQEDFDQLKSEIEQKLIELESLQEKHRSLTGRDYVMPMYLTDWNPVGD